MHSMSRSRVIDAPIEDVWAVLDDFGNLQLYSPKNETCRLLEGPETGVGARRETTLSEGSRVVHEIIEYEADERYKFDFTDTGDFPLKELQIEFEVESVAAERTRATMTADYVPKWGPIGWVLAKTIMPRKNAELLDETLAGLEKHLETGQPIGDGLTPKHPEPA